MELSKAVQVPFGTMVATLFKKQEHLTERLVHVAMGLTGEALELANATSRQNLIEELGDIEFYLEAGFLQFGYEVEQVADLQPSQLANVIPIIGSSTEHFQDLAKRCWVYEKSVVQSQFIEALLQIRYGLDNAYHYFGLTKHEVQEANKIKLIGPKGRFKDMEYTNDAAIARADKAPERSFIGQK